MKYRVSALKSSPLNIISGRMKTMEDHWFICEKLYTTENEKSRCLIAMESLSLQSHYSLFPSNLM